LISVQRQGYPTNEAFIFYFLFRREIRFY